MAKATETSSATAHRDPKSAMVSARNRWGNVGRLAFLLIPAVVIGLNVALLVEQSEHGDGSTSLSALQSAETQIVHMDEVLTMSARMYAATGDVAWKNRYLDHVDELDNLIAQARYLSSKLLGEDLVAKTNEANRVLVDLETRSFELVDTDRLSKAGAVLQSEEYTNSKAAYAAGMSDLWRRLRSLTRDRMQQRRTLLLVHGVASIICLVIVVYALRAGLRRSPRRRQAIDTNMPPPNIRDWRSILWASTTLLLFLLLTTIMVSAKRRSMDAEHLANFNRLANQTLAELKVRSEIPIYCLNGARGAYAASETVSRREFKAYFDSRDFREEFTGLIAFGFVQRVEREDLEEFVRNERTDDAPYFKTSASGTARDLYPIKFVEPFENNADDSGLDLGADPICRVAIERAIRTAEPVVTPPFKIVRGFQMETVIRYFVPVYANGVPPDSSEARVAGLEGVLFATVSTQSLLSGFSGAANGLIDVKVFDGRQLSDEKLLADTGEPGADDVEASRAASRHDGALYQLQTMDAVGREWSVEIRPASKLRSIMHQATIIEEAVAGVLISVLLAIFVFLQRTGKNRALALAQEMTFELSSAKNRAENALREIEAFRSTVDIRSLVSVTDTSGTIIEVNDLFCSISGYSRDELIGQNHRIINSGYHSAQFWKEVWREITAGRAWHGEICNKARDGKTYWVDSTIAPFRGENGKIQKFVAIRSDITERKRAEAQLRHTAQTDKLTAMPNRTMFNQRLEATVRRTRYAPDYHFAVLFIDFDRFKLVNDNFGHEIGDLLLKQVAARLNSVLRPSDAVVRTGGNLAARFGGDEFVILLDHLEAPDDAITVADRLLEVLAAAYDLNGHHVHSSASIGIVTSATASGTAEDILRDADVAMYEAKAAGRACYVVFDESMLARVRDRHDMETNLRVAIDDGNIHVFYQPIIEMDTGRVVSFEALVRWMHPEFGLIPPDRFIAMAEESGLIVPLGWYVMEQACRTLVRLRSLPGGADLSMNINVSRRQIVEPSFAQALKDLIVSQAIPASCLRLEITESVVIAAENSIADSLEALKALGVQLYMDDFGTGLSSLGLLRKLPLDGIKIDRCFIETADSDRESIAILHAIINLGHNLGMSVTAEGIENREQVATVLALECDLVQGYLFGHPLPPEEAEQNLEKTWGEFNPHANEELTAKTV